MSRRSEGRTVHDEARAPRCAQGGCLSALRWARWRAYHADDARFGEPPTLAFYCLACNEAEFSAGGQSEAW